MGQVLLFSVNAVVPILLLLMLGYMLTRTRFFTADFLKSANTLVFKLLLPMTIFHNIYTVETLSFFNWSLIIFSLFIITLLMAIGWLVAKLFVKPYEARGAFIQCTFRSNFAIMGLPLAESLGGAAGAAMAAVLSAFTIPLFNVFAVVVLMVYSDGQKKPSITKIIKDILTNPLILAAVAGLLCLFIRSLLPCDQNGLPIFTMQHQMPFLFKVIQWLHQASGPMALLVMGGLLDFSAIKDKLNNIVLGICFRLLIAPVIGLSLAVVCRQAGVFSCGAGEFGALIALFGSPVAVSSAVMASSIGGDAELARQYVVWTTVLSIISVFFFAFILRTIGLI